MESHLEGLLVKINYKKLIRHISSMRQEISLGKISGNKKHFENIEKELKELHRCIDTTENEIKEDVCER